MAETPFDAGRQPGRVEGRVTIDLTTRNKKKVLAIGDDSLLVRYRTLLFFFPVLSFVLPAAAFGLLSLFF